MVVFRVSGQDAQELAKQFRGPIGDTSLSGEYIPQGEGVYTLGENSSDSSQMMESYVLQDMIANDLTILPNFTARVRIRNKESTIKTLLLKS